MSSKLGPKVQNLAVSSAKKEPTFHAEYDAKWKGQRCFYVRQNDGRGNCFLMTVDEALKLFDVLGGILREAGELS